MQFDKVPLIVTFVPNINLAYIQPCFLFMASCKHKQNMASINYFNKQ